VSQTSAGAPPFRVVYSDLCRETTRQLLARAVAKGLFAKVAQAVRDVDHRLHWIPMDFGEPLHDLTHLRITKYIGIIPPLTVKYTVDEDRRIVHVALPFDLLSRSGL
jgi:hypothetical protein